jgi:hypothetical protein
MQLHIIEQHSLTDDTLQSNLTPHPVVLKAREEAERALRAERRPEPPAPRRVKPMEATVTKVRYNYD